HLPIGTAAYRFNLLSALSIAAAAGLVTAVSHQLTTRRPSQLPDWAAAATGLTFAFTPLVWSQAVITEVYGLNLLCLAAFLWALIGKRPSLLTGLLLGLSVTTHLTSLLMLPLAIWLTPRDRWGHLATGLLAGLTPFLLLPWLARGNSPVVWGEPTSFAGWWWLVSGRIYHANLFSLTRSAYLNRASEWAVLLARQFTWAGLLLIIFAFYRLRGENLRLRLGLGGTAVLYILYAFNYGTSDAVVLLLPALLLLSLLLMWGLRRLGWAALLLPAALLLLNYQSVDLSGDHSVRIETSALLQDAPEHAILLTPGDRTIFTLWYFQHVEGQRSDLILIDANLTAFDWYRERLNKRYPDIKGLETDNLLALQELNQEQRPFCTATLDPSAVQTLVCQ
ncbi:MAG: DUF2723 domain-containing protein, partial [Anaerolineae bacterium]